MFGIRGEVGELKEGDVTMAQEEKTEAWKAAKAARECNHKAGKLRLNGRICCVCCGAYDLED